MQNEIKNLKQKFYKVKERGWIKSDKSDSGSIGNTFENLIGVPNNSFEIPDFNQIEIKTKTKYSESYTTLFNCVSTGPHYHEVERLKNLYGYPDSKFKMYNVLNTSVYSKQKNKVGLNYFFELKVNKNNDKLYLIIYDKYGAIIENDVYWDFDILKEKLYRKLKYLAYVKALKKKIGNVKYLKYYQMKIYKLKDFNTFIMLLEKGIIRVTIKIGIFRDAKRIGKIHDYGTAFCIQENDLDKLYNLIEICK